MTTRIAMIGTGNVGGSLGKRLSNAGIGVTFGVREGSDAKDLLSQCADTAGAADPATAIQEADVVFVAVPGSAAVDWARSFAGQLEGKIVVDCTNPLRWQDGPVWAPPPEGSNAAAIAKAAPGARVVKGFNTFGAEFHGDPLFAGEPAAQVFFAGDDAAAKKTVSELATRGGFRPVDGGPLRNAAVLENVAMLWIHLATVGGHGRNFTLAMQARA